MDANVGMFRSSIVGPTMDANVGMFRSSNVGPTMHANVGTFRSPNVGPLIKCILAQHWLPMLARPLRTSGPTMGQQSDVYWVMYHVFKLPEMVLNSLFKRN